jgi:hypothetical protein
MSELSRRSLVATAAALPALAVPAVAVANTAEPDPIFKLIAAHQAAYAYDKAQTEEETDRLFPGYYELGCQLAETAPVTLAGVIAIMRYRRELQHPNSGYGYDLFAGTGEAIDPRDDITEWLAVIEQSLEHIARRAA